MITMGLYKDILKNLEENRRLVISPDSLWLHCWTLIVLAALVVNEVIQWVFIFCNRMG